MQSFQERSAKWMKQLDIGIVNVSRFIISRYTLKAKSIWTLAKISSTDAISVTRNAKLAQFIHHVDRCLLVRELHHSPAEIHNRNVQKSILRLELSVSCTSEHILPIHACKLRAWNNGSVSEVALHPFLIVWRATRATEQCEHLQHCGKMFMLSKKKASTTHSQWLKLSCCSN